MNTKLKIALIRRYSNQGFALPIAVGMGFIMLLIAATMIMRSQGDQMIALAQKDSAASLTISEVGVTRTLSAFKKHSASNLARESYDASDDNWSSILGTDAAQLVGTPDNRWIPLSTSGQTIGHFKIIEYTTSGGGGTLKVLGTTDPNTTRLSSTDLPQKAKSYLSVQISSSLGIDDWQRSEN